jgi:hypothetical protein
LPATSWLVTMRGATADLHRAHRRPDKERKAHNFHETEWKEGGHEPIWTEALWDSIQAVRRRAYRGSNGGKVHNIYPFRRLAVCDRCGANLYGEAHGSAKGRDPFLYMACITQRERHDCDQRAVRSAQLEDQIGAWLATLVIPSDWRADNERLQRRPADREGSGPRSCGPSASSWGPAPRDRGQAGSPGTPLVPGTRWPEGRPWRGATPRGPGPASCRQGTP